MKPIEIQLNEASIDRAIRELQSISDGFEEKRRKLCLRLGEIGVDVARVTYTAALYAGVNDTEVHLDFTEGGCTIVANGTALGFIEFGTGVKYPLGKFAGQVGAPPHGTYGKGKGKQALWGYYGEPGNYGLVIVNKRGKQVVITDGNPPANAFPLAVETMRGQIEQIAREVLADG